MVGALASIQENSSLNDLLLLQHLQSKEHLPLKAKCLVSISNLRLPMQWAGFPDSTVGRKMNKE